MPSSPISLRLKQRTCHGQEKPSGLATTPVRALREARAAAARKDLERSLAIQERSFGTASPHLVETLANLAELHFQHGRYAEAEPLYQRLLALHCQGAKYGNWDKVLANSARLGVINSPRP